MSTFTLDIQLGNDAMLGDVAHALDQLSERLHYGPDAEVGVIRDGNGNVVGRWGFSA